jgi:hypothetical protein
MLRLWSVLNDSGGSFDSSLGLTLLGLVRFGSIEFVDRLEAQFISPVPNLFVSFQPLHPVPFGHSSVPIVFVSLARSTLRGSLPAFERSASLK